MPQAIIMFSPCGISFVRHNSLFETPLKRHAKPACPSNYLPQKDNINYG